MATHNGIFNGEMVTITSNESGTHFYINGERISKNKALEAITAAKKEDNVSVEDINTFVSIPSIKPKDGEKLVDAKLNLLKSINRAALRLFLKCMRNEVAVGFSGKRLVKWSKEFDNRNEFSGLNAIKVGNLLDKFTKNGTRFELSKPEREDLLSCIPSEWDDNTLYNLGQILSGKVKLGIPSKLL